MSAPDLEKQLAAKRAAREAAQAKAEAGDVDAQLRQAIEDEDAIAQAIADHGAIGDAIALVETSMGTIIVKRPKQAVWRRFSDAPQTRGPDILTMVQACRVYPSAQRVEAILDTYPATLEVLGVACTTLAQSRTKEAAGK